MKGRKTKLRKLIKITTITMQFTNGLKLMSLERVTTSLPMFLNSPPPTHTHIFLDMPLSLSGTKPCSSNLQPHSIPVPQPSVSKNVEFSFHTRPAEASSYIMFVCFLFLYICLFVCFLQIYLCEDSVC